MAIDGLAPRFRELGRLKFGEDLGDRPGQLDTWRLTSPSLDLIAAAASLYGAKGPVLRGPEDVFEVTTTRDALDVLIPPQDVAQGQWFELWAAGGLQRRCTGTETVDVDHAGNATPTGPCQCDPAKRSCKLRTVLRVVLPELPDLGVWRLSTGSTYAAAELPPAVEAVLALNAGQLAPAVLALEARSTKRPGEQTHHYIVPILRTRATLAELLAGAPARGPNAGELGAGSVGPPSQPALPAQNPLTRPESPQIGPTGPADDPDGLETVPRGPGPLDELARFLTETDAGNLGATFDELLTVLDQLETLMVAAGLWKVGAIDAAAAKDGLHDHWRDGTMVADVRRLAVRATLAAVKALDENPAGYAARQRAGRSRP